MINAITSATQNPSVVQPTAASPVSPPAKPQHNASTNTDIVQISNAGRAALEEATETHANTVKEAHNGDRRAQRLLAKEAAAAKASER
jgi:hypothetical protein